MGLLAETLIGRTGGQKYPVINSVNKDLIEITPFISIHRLQSHADVNNNTLLALSNEPSLKYNKNQAIRYKKVLLKEERAKMESRWCCKLFFFAHEMNIRQTIIHLESRYMINNMPLQELQYISAFSQTVSPCIALEYSVIQVSICQAIHFHF